MSEVEGSIDREEEIRVSSIQAADRWCTWLWGMGEQLNLSVTQLLFHMNRMNYVYLSIDAVTFAYEELWLKSFKLSLILMSLGKAISNGI